MIYTFYSFKGGVGRSMALAGVAHVLARRDLRVLAVDFDLEAPGLERYFFEGERCQSIRQQRGLIDLIQRYRQALADPAEFERAEFKRWQDFRLTAISVAGSLGGSVDLMTAGQREPAEKYSEYALAVRSFDWQDFFHNWKGDLFFDWLRRQWRDSSGGYDVVLVDSRTGVTEMGGVCAYQLADVAVLLCAPNYQNLEGTRDVARDFRSDAVLGLRAGRPLEILAVPARLEDEHPQRDKFLDRFEEELGVEGLPMVLKAAGLDYRKLALPYLPEFAVEERLVGEAGAGAPGERAIAVFERLADALTLLAEPDTPLFHQREEALARLRGEQVEESIPLKADTTRGSAGNDVFLDFSWADAEWADRLRARLDQEGLRVFRLDEDAQPGSNWSDLVTRALDYSQNLFLCFGAEASSRWREDLIRQARKRENIRIVPVLLPGSDPAMLRAFGLSEHRWLDLRDGLRESAIGPFLASLRQPRADPRSAAPTAPAGDPYPGVRAYSEDESAFFFGREAEIQAVIAALQTHDILFIHGPAKVGKSSLVAAGLAPKLRRGPGGESFGNPTVHVTLIDVAGSEGLPDLEFETILAEGDGSSGVIVVDHIDSFPGPSDLFEAHAHRRELIVRLLALASPHLKIILVGRDTLPDELRTTFLAEWGSRIHRIGLELLQGEALRRAIEEPAKRAGHLLEPGLTERLIESGGTARSAIFQIQLALNDLWPHRRRGWLTNASLNVLGHLGGIFNRHLEHTLAGLTDLERAGARVLFKSLSSLDSALKLKAEQQPWADLASIPALARANAVRLRDRLAGAGAVDVFRGPMASRDNEEAVQLSLVRRNPQPYFGGETVPDAAFFLWRGQFATFVQSWRGSASAESALIAGPPLDEAERWLAPATATS